MFPSVKRMQFRSDGLSVVSVVLCTFRRPLLLKNCLASLLVQNCTERFEVVIVDNDRELSGERIAASFWPLFLGAGIPFVYLAEPVQNISLARNLGVSAASGEWVAFLDDDETASPDWLASYLGFIASARCNGVFGPVLPEYPSGFPEWLRRSGMFDRCRLPTGTKVPPSEFRSGNAFFLRRLLLTRPDPFDPRLGLTGGEDFDFFSWLRGRGGDFRWCDAAVVMEYQDESRKSLSWHIRRGYRCGWVFAAVSFRRKRAALALLLVLGSLGSGAAKSVFRSLRQIRNPRGAFLLLITGLAVQAGKICYFFSENIQVYRQK